MYASAEQRTADIDADSTLPYHQLMARVHESATALESGIAELSSAAWDRLVVTAQGRTVPFTEVPWMRARESFVHVVDLDAGFDFADLPEGFNRDLLDEVTARMSTLGGPALLLMAPGKGYWTVDGTGSSTTVLASVADLTRWVIGRGASNIQTTQRGPLPEIPRWL